MLKLVAGLVAGATLLTVGTVSAYAATQGHGLGDCTKTRVCDTANCSAQCYVDGDNDGVCDNRGTVCNGRYYVDLDQGGVCDNQGQNYVDADNNGVCDNQGQNYVDANNDGICDNQVTRCQGGNQSHHGNGYQGGHHG